MLKGSNRSRLQFKLAGILGKMEEESTMEKLLGFSALVHLYFWAPHSCLSLRTMIK